MPELEGQQPPHDAPREPGETPLHEPPLPPVPTPDAVAAGAADESLSTKPTTHPEPPSIGGASEPDAGPILESLVASIDSRAGSHTGPEDLADSQPSALGEARRFIVFTSGDVLFGALVGEVVEILVAPKLTLIPNVPSWIAGVTNLRGEVLAVVDWGRFLGSEATRAELGGRLLVFHEPHRALTLGIWGDSLIGARIVDDAQITPATGAGLKDRLAALVSGVTEIDGRALLLLDVEKLFKAPEIQQLMQD